MKALLAIFAFSLCIAVVGCGDSGKGKHLTSATSTAAATTTATASSTSRSVTTAVPASNSLKGDDDDDDTGENLGNTSKDNDSDFDNDLKPQPGYNDSDDGSVRNYGHAAGAAQGSKLKGIVVRYYVAAARGDGVGGCSVTDANYVKAIPEDYGSGAGPAYARGKTCPVVLSAIFQHAHAELAAPVLVTAVRVQGSRALVLVGSTTMTARYVLLQREQGVWGIVGLLGTPMP